ncbi:MAG: hypothetical protein KDB22_20245, partial [Planctomycetales bacterium]|nr:hypothetical protein [Planctomycetales bacterium]
MKSVLIWTLLANRHQFNLLSQREGYFPQSPKVRFLGTVHPFGEYLPRDRSRLLVPRLLRKCARFHGRTSKR